jgi:hypothetical protein
VFLVALGTFTIGFVLNVIKIRASGTYIFLALFAALTISSFSPWATGSSPFLAIPILLSCITLMFSAIYPALAYGEKKQQETSGMDSPSSSSIVAWRALKQSVLMILFAAFVGGFVVLFSISPLASPVVFAFLLLGALAAHSFFTIRQAHTKKEPVISSLLWALGWDFAFLLVVFLLYVYDDHYTLNGPVALTALFLLALSGVFLICSLLLRWRNKQSKQVQNL